MRRQNFLFFLLLFASSIAVRADGDGLRQTVEYMASLGSRMSGYPGGQLAADYVEQELRALGFARVEREAFSLAVPIDRGGQLVLADEGKRITLYGVWPNLVRTTTLPDSGIVAPMIYGGDGQYADLSGNEIQGRVVLLEFNSWNNWLRAASLGARAIVFIEPEQTTRAQADEKFSSAPLNVPRFWIGRQEGLYLKEALATGEQSVSMRSRMDWREKTAWNIWAQVPGTDPELKDDTIVVEAYFDGVSVVPALAPSAEMASSIAALLDLARHLREYPPARSVVLVATDAHFQGRQ